MIFYLFAEVTQSLTLKIHRSVSFETLQRCLDSQAGQLTSLSRYEQPLGGFFFFFALCCEPKFSQWVFLLFGFYLFLSLVWSRVQYWSVIFLSLLFDSCCVKLWSFRISLPAPPVSRLPLCLKKKNFFFVWVHPSLQPYCSCFPAHGSTASSHHHNQ